MFLPTTKDEINKLGWTAVDIILVTGDSYIDSPYVGIAVIGQVLRNAGYRVAVIAQPDISSNRDITRLGEPTLFWGVSAGCIDSMVANRTATGKKRRTDDYTPGGSNDLRPDRATIVYSNLIRQHFKNTSPIVLGGIEASLRRIAHYDFWTDKIRKSVLFDAKANYLLYGMSEKSVLDLASCLKNDEQPSELRGLCYISNEKKGIELPSYQETMESKDAFTSMFHTFYKNNDPITAKPLSQKHDTRYLVQNPPADYMTSTELDSVYDLPYERDLHPYYAANGKVKALETIRFSMTTHRGCYGECNFCAIAVHEGRTVRWRSEKSIIKEARTIANLPGFKGTIMDVGGPTANMYGFECSHKLKKGACPDKRCLYPEICPSLKIDHSTQTDLLKELRKIDGVKKIVVASGIRYDMVLNDKKHGREYLNNVVCHHVSGQLKIAPEHSEPAVLDAMGKPNTDSLLQFRKLFYKMTAAADKDQYLTYYMIAAHPGCTQEDMNRLSTFAQRELKLKPRQVQVFTPTPSTYSTLMYYTEKNPFTGEPCFSEKKQKNKENQKNVFK